MWLTAEGGKLVLVLAGWRPRAVAVGVEDAVVVRVGERVLPRRSHVGPLRFAFWRFEKFSETHPGHGRTIPDTAVANTALEREVSDARIARREVWN